MERIALFPTAVVVACAVFSSFAQAATVPSELSQFSWYFDPPQKGFPNFLKDYIPTCSPIDKGGIDIASAYKVEYSQSEETAKTALDRVVGLNDVVKGALGAVQSMTAQYRSALGRDYYDAIESIISLAGSLSVGCNNAAYESTVLALRSDSQAWQVLSAQVAKFRNAYGDRGPAGKASALSAKLGRIKYDFESEDAKSDSLAGKIMRLRIIADKEAKDGNLLDPRDARQVLIDGVSKTSVLQDMFNLDGEAEDALFELDRIFASSKMDAESAQKNAAALLKRYGAEELEKIDSLAVRSVLPKAIAGSPAVVGSYGEIRQSAEAMVRAGDSAIERAAFVAKEQAYGYESDGIGGHDFANANYSTASTLLQAKLDEAEAAAQSLEAEYAKKLADAKAAVEQAKAEDPVAGIELEKKLDGILQEGAYTKNIFQRIDFSARSINELDGLAKAATGGAASALLDMLKGASARLSDMVGQAEKDGLECSHEKARSGSINAAIENHMKGASGYALSPAVISNLTNEVANLQKAIIGKALSKYAALPADYAKAAGYSAILGFADAGKIRSWSHCFGGGALLAGECLGSLKTISDGVSDILASVQTSLKKNIEALLSGAMQARKANTPALPGQVTEFTVTFTTANPLGSGYDGPARIELGKAPEVPFSYRASGGMVLSDGAGIYALVENPAQFEKFEFVISYSYVAATAQPAVAKTDYASSYGARIISSVSVDAAEDMDILLEFPSPSQAVVRLESGETPISGGGKARFVAGARRGKNAYTAITSLYQAPYSISETVSDKGGAKEARLELTNTFADLDLASADYSPSVCNYAHVISVDSLDFSAHTAGAITRLEAKRRWNLGETLKAAVKFECAEEILAFGSAENISQLASSLEKSGTLADGAGDGGTYEKLGDFRRFAQSILEDSKGFPQYGAIESLVADKLDSARAAYYSKDGKTASKEIDGIQEDLEKQAIAIGKQRLAELEKACGEPACTRTLSLAKTYLAASDAQKAFEQLSIAQGQADSKEAESLGLQKSKMDIWAGFQSGAQLEAQEAMARFDAAFLGSANQSASAFSKLNDDGFNAYEAQGIRKKLAEQMEKLKASGPSSKNFNATGAEALAAGIDQVEKLTASLNSATQSLGNATQRQIDVASQAAHQGDAAADTLAQAKKYSSDGNYFLGYLLAKELQKSAPAQKPVEKAQFDFWAYLPVMVAVVACGGLALRHFGAEEKKAKPLLEKPPEDFSN
jgi:hypothetical protein